MRTRLIYYIMVLAVLFATSTAHAQEVVVTDELIYDRTMGFMVAPEQYHIDDAKPCRNIQQVRWQNNLRIGYGVPSLISIMFSSGSVIGACDYCMPQYDFSDQLHDSRYYNTPTLMLQSLHAEYMRTINPWFSMGVKSTFAATWSSLYNAHTGELYMRNNSYAISALVSLRFEWLRRHSVQMYSGFGAGLAARIERANGALIPMLDLTLVGLSVGRGFYGFVEIGEGISGSFRGGFGLRF